MATGLGLLSVLVLVVLNGVFVAAEFALVSVRQTRIAQLAQAGSARARLVQQALAQLDTYIAATQLGITMASLALGFIGKPAIATVLEPLLARVLPGANVGLTAHGVALVLAYASATALHIVIGELAPKSIALQRAEATALWVTPPLNLFLKVFYWPIRALNGVGNGLVRLIGLRPAAGHAAVHSVEELGLLVRSSREAGVLEEQQERMVAGVFDFGERQASRVMTPRTEIAAVPVTIGLPELTERAAAGRHSRLPVYAGDLDNILGVVHVKDVLRVVRDRRAARAPFDVRPLMRPVPFVPDSVPLDELMAELRRERAHLAIVIDEFGGTAGLVTLEDLLEEIVGEVADEFDAAREPIEPLPGGRVALDGLLPIEEVAARFALGVEEPFYDTLGGHVFGRLGRAAVVGDELALPDGRRLRVAELDGLRIARVLLLPRRAPDHDGHPHPAGKGDGSAVRPPRTASRRTRG
ncbi:MAG: hemolysin family protein [Chloroflexota bacterium]|nr:hemolysin family protein [Chloroflexota bacterium]